jgi:hypothetical protein
MDLKEIEYKHGNEPPDSINYGNFMGLAKWLLASEEFEMFNQFNRFYLLGQSCFVSQGSSIPLYIGHQQLLPLAVM